MRTRITTVIASAIVFMALLSPLPAQQNTPSRPAPADTPACRVDIRLPADGPLPRTYRVTLAVVDPDNPDWIVSTFVSGGVRTVTAENGGKFTEVWNGLDENDMPVPPGKYRVKGIFMPAEKWAMDGQFHSIIPKYLVGLGDSWSPSPEQDARAPWIHGHQFGPMSDVAVGPNGVAGFWAGYIESARNPFLVDLNRPVNWEQVLKGFPSGGTAGGSAVACDGEHIYAACNDGGAFLFRDDRQWGGDRVSIGIRAAKLEVNCPSLAAWKEPRSGKGFLYAAQPVPANRVDTFALADGRKISGSAVRNPQAVFVDRTGQATLHALHQGEKDEWLVSSIALKDGVPDGAWRKTFTLAAIGRPDDCDMDSKGNFYVASSADNQVFKLDGTGRILARWGGGAKVANGRYEPQDFHRPARLAMWKDRDGADRVIVVEQGGARRTSEWSPEGKLLRSWFLCRTGARGFCADPENPEHVYIADESSNVTRYRVDYAKATWEVDGLHTDLPLGGMQFPQVLHREGRMYLAFPGGTDGGNKYAVYRQDGERLVPSAGIIRDDKKQPFFWADSDGDGKVQPEEYRENPARLPGMNWDGDVWLDDLSLVMLNRADLYMRNIEFHRLAPREFDRRGNPVFDGRNWSKFLDDPIYSAVRQKKASPLKGGGEISEGYGSWERIAGNMKDGFYTAYNFGPNGWGGIDSAGVRHAHFKLSRYVPDGQGGYQMKWRVGRKAWQLADPGRVYGSYHLTAPSHGLVGVFDMNGVYHLYTEDGLYVDTLMYDGFRHGGQGVNMYSHGGEMWFGQHFLNKKNGKVYLFMGRASANVYECRNWTPDLIRPLPLEAAEVVLSAEQIAPPDPRALAMHGGAGVAPVVVFRASPGGGPALDGSLAGWEAAQPVKFGLDAERRTEVRCLYDRQQLYLRWHIRTAGPIQPADATDLPRIFTHDRKATTASFYIQGDPAAAPGGETGRAGDVRIVFALINDEGETKPVAVGLYPKGSVAKPASPVTYVSPVRTAAFEHVAVLSEARLAHALDEDGRGFVLSAAIPLTAIPLLPPPNAKLRTMVDFSVTLNGVACSWWANTGRLNNTLTTDEPSEANLYPGAWAQAQFTGLDSLPVLSWSVGGPWGGPELKTAPRNQTPGDSRFTAFAKRHFQRTKYPPDLGEIDLGKIYQGPETADHEGKQHEVRWRTMVASELPLSADPTPFRLYFATAWIFVPEDSKLRCRFITNEGATGNGRGWLNGKPLPEQAMNNFNVAGTEIVPQAEVTFKKGWNQIVLRSWGNWTPARFGLVIQGAPDVLWAIKTSPTAPAGQN